MNVTNWRRARIVHLAWCAYQAGAGLPFNEFPTRSQMLSQQDGLRAFAANPKMTNEENHENWRRYKLSQGWVLGAVKDEQAKTHPDLVPYDDLTEVERAKDDMDLMARRCAFAILPELGK